tara:strand:- start:101029 stop:102270 length:1242 start_codon:yes stop_codon:yes gene_type:complete
VNPRPPTLYIHSLEADRLGDGLSSGETSGLGGAVLRSLSSRAMYLSKPGDAVVLDSEPDPGWLSCLSSIGLVLGDWYVPKGEGTTLAQRLLSDDDLMQSLRSRSMVLSPYMGGDEVQHLATELGFEIITPPTPLLDTLNLKSNLQPILVDLGLPTISTTITNREELISKTRDLLNETGAVMVRSDLSIGGLGVWKVESDTDLDTLHTDAKRSNPDRLFILQPLLDVTSSPNVQYDITEQGFKFLGVSEQQMTQSFAFGGNEFPSPFGDDPRLIEQSDRVAEWLHTKGYLGLVGIDFIVTVDDHIYIVEINPRVNTSTFPLMLCSRLGRKAFRLVTGIRAGAHTGFQQMAETISPDLLYDPNRGNGVIPLMIPSSSRPVLDAMVFADDLDTLRSLCNVLSSRTRAFTAAAGVKS